MNLSSPTVSTVSYITLASNIITISQPGIYKFTWVAQINATSVVDDVQTYEEDTTTFVGQKLRVIANNAGSITSGGNTLIYIADLSSLVPPATKRYSLSRTIAPSWNPLAGFSYVCCEQIA